MCGNRKFITVFAYKHPDKYEQYVGLKTIHRNWVRCLHCGFHFQIRDYELKDLEMMYKNGYRDKEFRGETIEEAFNRINAIEDNENESRYVWFAMNIKFLDTDKFLDIGSGIGVWPNILKKAGFKVDCVEENEQSIDFIYEKLGMKCFQGIEAVGEQYDAVSLIHVLEHIEKPGEFLKKVKNVLRPAGTLFVEVPDASEFNYLPMNHDEFNSCHVAFYDMGSLYRVLRNEGFTVTAMHIEKTKQRNLTRVMCVAIN